MESFFNIYEQFKALPKCEKIKNPEGLVFGCFLSEDIKKCLSLREHTLYFSRRSLKHIAEKGNDDLILLLGEICTYPEEIRESGKKSRYLIIKYISEIGNRPYVVCIEIKEKSNPVIVTAFSTDDKYLSNFDLLWRTGAS